MGWVIGFGCVYAQMRLCACLNWENILSEALGINNLKHTYTVPKNREHGDFFLINHPFSELVIPKNNLEHCDYKPAKIDAIN